MLESCVGTTPVTTWPRLSHEPRGLSCDHDEGVEATWDAIAALTKSSSSFLTLSQHLKMQLQIFSLLDPEVGVRVPEVPAPVRDGRRVASTAWGRRASPPGMMEVGGSLVNFESILTAFTPSRRFPDAASAQPRVRRLQGASRRPPRKRLEDGRHFVAPRQVDRPSRGFPITRHFFLVVFLRRLDLERGVTRMA